jgi:uncharacterized membrane protein
MHAAGNGHAAVPSPTRPARVLLGRVLLLSMQSMNRLTLSLVSAAAGALLMLCFDPVSGRRRRALAEAQLDSAACRGRHFASLVVRDGRNRASGLAAEARSLVRRSASDDKTLTARVRSRLGRVVSHPHALQVTTREGDVTLSGPVLSAEAEPVLACARRVPGVRRVDDRLERHESAKRIPSLQGGVPRPGPARWEFSQQSWSPSARALAATGAAVLGGVGLALRRPWSPLAIAASAARALRSVVNRELVQLVGPGKRSVRVEKTTRIEAAVERVFAFWRDVRNFPNVMTHVHRVSGEANGITHWEVGVSGAGPHVEWSSRCTEVVENQRIAWATLPGSAFAHAGVVRFEDTGDGATRVHILLDYEPPGGAVGDGVARLLQFDPKSQLDDDLLRVKCLLETGRAPHDAAAGRRGRNSKSTAPKIPA